MATSCTSEPWVAQASSCRPEKNFIPDDADHRTVASWIGGLEDLERGGYIRGTVAKGELFEVTREGYAAADSLS